MSLAPAKLARVIVIAMLASAPAWAPIASAQNQPAADLAVTIKANTKHPRAHHAVFFTVTVRNRGPNATTGFVVALRTVGGLASPRVVAAPSDSIQEICTNGGPPCRTHLIPPECHSGRTRLTCRYRFLQLTPPGGPSSSLTLVFKATTGKRRHERADASVAGANDPNAANNHKTAGLNVKVPPRRHQHA